MSYTNVLAVVGKTSRGRLARLAYDQLALSSEPFAREWDLPEGPYFNGNSGSVIAIADGMRGSPSAEAAASISIETVRQHFINQLSITRDDPAILDLISHAFRNAHNAIVKSSNGTTHKLPAAATLLIAWIVNCKLYVGWSGKSRCYHYRGSLGLKQVNKDHSIVQSLVDSGSLETAAAVWHPLYNRVTQHLGDPERPPRTDCTSIQLAANDIVLVCSDGLPIALTDGEIASLVELHQNNLSVCAEALINAANKASGVDNVTVVVAKLPDGIDETDRDRSGDHE